MFSDPYLPKAWRFHDLMPHRVREVLLVSSHYDAFILEQDGQLTQQAFLQFRDISPQASPRFSHAPSGEAALELLERRHFDLIVSMATEADVDANTLGRRAKERYPDASVVLLGLDRRELHALLPRLDPETIDGAFLWTGDSNILLAIIKSVEDLRNVDHDVERGDVRVIIVVEDSPAHYSSFLGLLYRELMTQALSLQFEGASELLRRIQMRSRPKVLLARSYELGLKLTERYRHNLLALISDVRIPRGGEFDDRAGFDLVRQAREHDPDLPVLIQSTEAGNRELAEAEGAIFVDKNSSRLPVAIREFLTSSLGFGDFVFRDQLHGDELARARDLRELEEELQDVPESSISYHARHNHFSIWLMARSEFELAKHLRPQTISDFGTAEGLREHLIKVVRASHRETHRGVVSDFERENFEHNAFSRIGQGSLGGKARGLAFLNLLLARTGTESFGGLQAVVPKTVVIAADLFDRFIEENDLRELVYSENDDETLAHRFLEAVLPEPVANELEFLVEAMPCPLAVRSSSLLEDSMHQPFAGIYTTLMLPNCRPSREERARRLGDAIKWVYASTFFRDARSYLASTGLRNEDEKMAVIIQPVAGDRHGERFYPSFSGVAQSYNYYPLPPQAAEDGIVHVALGLGRMVVDGGQALRFSPRHPEVLPQFADVKAFLDRSQREFHALDMTCDVSGFRSRLEETVHGYRLSVAEKDDTLWPVGSVFVASEKRIRDDLSLPGPRMVSFNNILKHRAIPLADALTELLTIGRLGMGCPVEIEFACELGDWGRRKRDERQEPCLYVLQVRPIAVPGGSLGPVEARFSPDELICASAKALGNGVIEEIRDIVYVSRGRWDSAHHKMIAREVGELNAELSREARPYVLIGPGRWGSADPWLGIPVKWSQISGARVIVEASPVNYNVEPSQGTHFFQNITSLNIGYLTLPPGAERDPQNGGGEFVDWQWLDAQEAADETEHLRHLHFEEPLTVMLDGREGRGLVARPGAARE